MVHIRFIFMPKLLSLLAGKGILAASVPLLRIADRSGLGFE
jgi:hypothetical protein